MKNRELFYVRITSVIFALLILFAFRVGDGTIDLPDPPKTEPDADVTEVYLETADLETLQDILSKVDTIQEEQVIEGEVIIENDHYEFTEKEVEMIAQLTMAEAGNQTELGKRLVIDVVLNRLDHENFPDTVYGVIYQKNQFSPVSSGSFDRCYPTEENIRLVKEEIERRTDHDVMFFRAGKYGNYGTPMYCVGDHYFSSYD